MLEKKDTRLYGLDALKVLSMLMVVILHTLSKGGILGIVSPGTVNYYTAWFLEVACYGAVDIFAAVTGYLMIDRKFKSSRIISVWLQVLGYSFLITIVGMVLIPEAFGLKSLVKSLLPVTMRTWWYFSAYFGLCFLMPFVNKLLNALSKREFTILVCSLFGLFSLVGLRYDAFALDGGYGLIWLTTMYIMGAYLKKHGDVFHRLGNFPLMLIFFGCTGITWLTKPYDPMLISYISPTVTVAALALVLLFSRIQLPRALSAVAAFLSPLSFAVYIIHEHLVIRQHFMPNRFRVIGTYNPVLLVLAVLGCAIAIFLVCALVEFVRDKLFKVCKIHTLVNQVGAWIDTKLKLQ